MRENGFSLPKNVDLVLELEVIPEKDRHDYVDSVSGKQCIHHWTYYYANHDERVLFWLQPYEIISEDGYFHEIEPVMCVQSGTHISESQCQFNIALLT